VRLERHRAGILADLPASASPALRASLRERLAAAPPSPGARVLELGCGLALPSIAAARSGASVLATDGSADAAVFAAHNLALNEVEGEVLPGDWRAAGEQLAAQRWDLVLAADVLYLRENVESLLRLLPRLMGPETETWLADPRRAGADEFLPAARKLWKVESAQDPQDDRIMLHRLRPRRAG
jgi:predicted nicotinamide N-methyase